MNYRLKYDTKNENINNIDGKEKMISIIVPVYNVEKYIRECIESLINQTYKNIEIILINDGSTDNCGKICDEYAKKDKRVKVIHKKNGGVSSARNVGLQNSKGDYIAFVDSDDTVNERIYELLYNSIIDNNSDIAICNYNPNSKFDNIPQILDRDEVLDYILDKDKFRGYLWNKLYKKEVLKDQNFNKDIHICEDLLFNCEYILKCNICSIINERLYNYNTRERKCIK